MCYNTQDNRHIPLVVFCILNYIIIDYTCFAGILQLLTRISPHDTAKSTYPFPFIYHRHVPARKESIMKKIALPYIMTFIGCIICTVGINAFFIPHHLLSGGIGGITIMLYYTMGFPIGISMIVINIPIMIACYKFMGRQYTLLSVCGTIMFSVLVDATSFLSALVIVQDRIISTITGGICTGIGMGLMYRFNGNSGGLDVVAAIIKKFYSLEMGNIIMIINAFIIACAAYLFSLELAILTFVGTYVTAMLTNKVVIGLNQRKTAFIVSSHADEIVAVVMRYIGRGATILHGQGAYTHQDKRVVYIVISLTQIAKIKELVNKIDPQAFMIISDASEVLGLGFTRPLNKNHPIDDDALAIPKIKKPLPPQV